MYRPSKCIAMLSCIFGVVGSVVLETFDEQVGSKEPMANQPQRNRKIVSGSDLGQPVICPPSTHF
jgi:hypothetical protein